MPVSSNASKQAKPTLPSVESLSNLPAVQPFIASLSRPVVIETIRELLSALRAESSKAGNPSGSESLEQQLVSTLKERMQRKLQKVINGTGILIHTNLGRAPIPLKVLAEVTPLLSGYINLEYDLVSGERGSRGADIESALSILCGTESSTVTNNCAAALVLIVNTFAQKKEVVISRSELVQIGGGFRIPDILVRAGARLREVGTTNITTLNDYESAITGKTAMILKVHQSNFVQRGFEASVSLADLGTLAKNKEIPLVYDLGSGLLDNRLHPALSEEPTSHSAIRSGADIVCFSGDKLFGGTQGGIIVGRKLIIEKIKRNPLFRAFRLDKCSLALLSETVTLYLEKRERELPVWQMLSVKESDLYTRARNLIAALTDTKHITVESCHSQIGGGALPEKSIPSVALCIRGKKAKQITTALRKQTPAIIARIQDENVLLDLRTVDPSDDTHLISALNKILAP